MPETESELIARAQEAVSQCSWVVGQCAAEWTSRYARGRTDADFAQLIGLSADQVYQRRRVWETFSDVHRDYGQLSWSHFYVALTWDDAPECLAWAEEQQASVAEMKAWRRAQRGEDLSEAPSNEWETDDWGNEPSVYQLPNERTVVRDLDVERGGSSDGTSAVGVATADGERDPTAASVAREGNAAMSTTELPPSTEQILRKLAGGLERVDRALTPELLAARDEISDTVRERFTAAVFRLAEKAESLV